jgi:hypothetical protein
MSKSQYVEGESRARSGSFGEVEWLTLGESVWLLAVAGGTGTCLFTTFNRKMRKEGGTCWRLVGLVPTRVDASDGRA